MKIFCRLSITFLLFVVLLSVGSASAGAEGSVEYEFAFAVHSIRDNQYMHHVGPDPFKDPLYDNEYYALYMTIHNHTGQPLHYANAVLSVDGDSYQWNNITVNTAYSLYLSRGAMQTLSAGKHICTLTLDGILVHSNTFALPRDWQSLMNLPTREQAFNRSADKRSPYIAFWTEFGTKGGYTDYAIDVHTDHQPCGTYICPISWWMDLSALENNYVRAWSDFGGAGGGYCGLQVWDDGTKGVIMTLWDVFCQDTGGNIKQIKAKVLYPENATDTNHNNSSEGSFVHYSYPYNWEAGKDYRFLLQQSAGANGNVLMTLWIMEVESGPWTKLFCFDTGMQGIWIKSAGGFLENYILSTAADIRTMEFWNIRARMRQNGEWENAKSISYGVNASVGISEYEGSYNFGQDNRSCWIITSGVPGLGVPNSRTGPYPVPSTGDILSLPQMDSSYSSYNSSSSGGASSGFSSSSFYESPVPPEEYDEFLRSGDWILDLAWADMGYDALLFWPSTWCVYDVDGNNIPELIVQINGFWLIYTQNAGQIKLISTGALARDMTVSVCPELNIVRFEGGYTSWSFASFIKIQNGAEVARYDYEKEDPDYDGFAAAEVDFSLSGKYITLEQNDVVGLEPYA